MEKITAKSAAGVLLLAALSLAGCTSNGHTENTTFEFDDETLNVVHNNSYMPVSVSSHSTADEISVEVTTQTLGQNPDTPAWSLTDGRLNLGSPCGGNVIGYCEGSYAIHVPENTEVLVNGTPTLVN